MCAAISNIYLSFGLYRAIILDVEFQRSSSSSSISIYKCLFEVVLEQIDGLNKLDTRYELFSWHMYAFVGLIVFQCIIIG